MTLAQDKKDIDTNGWFEVKDNPLSKEGFFFIGVRKFDYLTAHNHRI